MPDFKGSMGTPTTPWGVNEFLRSTEDFGTESYTVSALSVPAVTRDGNPGMKELKAGTVMAKIITGGEAGKIGPYSTDTVGVTDGRSTPANIVGLNLTSLPWQLMDRDVEVSCVYDCEAIQGWCIEYTATGPQPLSNATAATMQRGGAAGKMVDIGWH